MFMYVLSKKFNVNVNYESLIYCFERVKDLNVETKMHSHQRF